MANDTEESSHSSEDEEQVGDDAQIETGHTITDEEPGQQLLQAPVQSLEATNRKLTRENYFLRKYLSLILDSDLKEQQVSNEYKKLRSSNAGSSSVVSLRQYQGAQVNFPFEVLYHIFNTFKQQEIILKCRFVCHQWNYTITNYTKLMEEITFPIWHPNLFLDLQIANQVKSIVFKESFEANSAYLTKFLDVISKTVKKVTFDYKWDENSILNQQKNFLDVLGKCTELEELKIIGSNKQLMKACSENTVIAAGNTIKKLSIKPKGLNTVVDCARISEILLKLPNLAELEIFLIDHDFLDAAILRAVCNYMVMYPTVLKELRIINNTWPSENNEVYNTSLLKIALIAGKNGTTLSTTNIPINLNSLLNFEETDQQLLIDVPSTKLIKSGILKFLVGNKLNKKNLNRFKVCTQLKQLFIQFNRNLTNEDDDLIFLRNFLDIENLTIICNEGFRLNYESIIQLEQEVFSNNAGGGLPLIKDLGMAGDVFGLPCVWSRYFPNLESLTLQAMKITPKDLFIVLSTLEKLVGIYLQDLTELEDEAFTNRCKSKQEEQEVQGIEEIETPAIATFKMLNWLTIKNCPKLTDKCIVDGISKITTLEELEIENMPNLTHDVCNGYHFKVDYKEA